MKGVFVSLGVVACLVGCSDNTDSGNKSTSNVSQVSVPTINEQLNKTAYTWALKQANKITKCDKSYDFKVIEPKYGTVSHDYDKYMKTFQLGSLVPAIMTGVEFTCQNNRKGTKNKVWSYLIIGLDKEFNQYRCPSYGSATEYQSDGNTPLKYNPDRMVFGSTARSQVEEQASKCGFVSQ